MEVFHSTFLLETKLKFLLETRLESFDTLIDFLGFRVQKL